MGEPFKWDESWGDPEDYNIVKDRDELDGIKVGSRVRARYDGNGDDQAYFAGDEGIVIGVSVTAPGLFNPSGLTDLTVAFDGMDPTSADPSDLEVIE